MALAKYALALSLIKIQKQIETPPVSYHGGSSFATAHIIRCKQIDKRYIYMDMDISIHVGYRHGDKFINHLTNRDVECDCFQLWGLLVLSITYIIKLQGANK